MDFQKLRTKKSLRAMVLLTSLLWLETFSNGGEKKKKSRLVRRGRVAKRNSPFPLRKPQTVLGGGEKRRNITSSESLTNALRNHPSGEKKSQKWQPSIIFMLGTLGDLET